MTCDGEAHWYLSVKYTSEASGTISASQELYINKILKRWGMESCKPLPTPLPAKSNVVLDELLKPIEDPDPVLNKQFQEIIGQLLYCQQQTVPEISWSEPLIWRSPRRSFATYKAEKASLFAGALALVNSRICLVTSMPTPAPALLI
jgi:hypothetical protein